MLLASLALVSGCAMRLGPPLEMTPSLQSQSCVFSPGCMAPAASGEIIPATPAVIRAAQTVRGLLTLKDCLDEAEVARVEAVLVQCAREADFEVNEREYPRERYLLHLVRDATRIQFLYDFFFPCTSKSKSDPLSPGRQVMVKKLEKYEPLTKRQSRALVTPQLGISR
ncbi:hypothetical protein BON30_34050 [Cystobacter ferrugineus]|uniref:Uncharacterized protein n=1 Tax=Cystobacter ferrugineus TaxID=83449 RepID=A0A1L9B1U6_9BACT|nr:hypothetical protein BON30_34050 [Cystobacter ferrugineus]